jgi:type IV secretion system protein VirB4
MSLEYATPDVISAFTETFSLTALIAGIIGIIGGAAAFVGFIMPAVSKLVLPAPEETRLADFLPFDRVLPDGKTLACRDGTLAQCLEVVGLDDTFLNPHEREVLFLARKDWVDTLSDSEVAIRSFLLRERVDLVAKSTHSNPVLREIARRWNNSFSQSYNNRQILVLSISGKVRNPLSKLAGSVEVTKTILNKYGCKEMSQHDPEPEKRPLAFLARLISPLSQPKPGGIGSGVSDALCADQVEFGGDNGLVTFRSGNKQLLCAVIGIRSLGDFTYEAFINSINTVHGEIVVMHAIEPWSKTKAAFTVTQQYRLSMAQRFSPGAVNQFEDAIDRIEGNSDSAQAMCAYSLTIFAYGKTQEELDLVESEIKQIATGFGISPVHESAAAQASWFCQFPGYKIWPRPYKLFSRNIANHLTLERPPIGLRNSDWGDGPITTFRTSSGTAYAFQFHISEAKAAVAHAVAIGPTGSGKTTLINFLTAMAMRHEKLRCYMVDRHGGAYIFCNAVNGSYITFEGSDMEGTESALNPFQCTDNVQNRSFLRAFLQALSECEDADSIEEIGFAIEAAFENPGLPFEKRSLANIYDACFSKARPLRKGLNKWVDPAVYGKIFNAQQDTLDLTSTRLVILDFTRIYEHDDLARAVILYLMHRIQAAISELQAPALIFIDETEPVVKHPIFRNYFMQMLQEYRKKSSAIISAFQRPEAIVQAGLGEAIRGQAQTTFFFQNPQAQEREYADWGLTDREWAYIKGKLPSARGMRYSVLMKRATGESVILDNNLAALGPLIRVFYSDQASRSLAEQLMRDAGPDWLNIYLDST